jgi:ABC-2 type transport system permease protein
MTARAPAGVRPAPPIRIFGAFLARDVRVVRKEFPYFLIRTALQPIFMLAVFGFLLPRMGAVPRGYAITLLPGVLAMSLALAALQAVALPMIVDFGFGKEIEDRLLAPAPIQLIAIEKLVSGTLQGLIAASVMLPVARLVMGPIPSLSPAHVGLALLEIGRAHV